MELNKLWQEMKAQQQPTTFDQLRLKKTDGSKHPIRTLRKNLIISLISGILFSLAGIYIMILHPAWSLHLLLGILILKSQYFHWLMWQRIRAFDRLLKNWDQPLLLTLKEHVTLTRKTLRIIEIRTLLFLPLAYLAGLLLGGSIEGDDPDTLLTDFSFLAIGMGLSLLTMPLLYFLYKWMHKKAFGDYLARTEELIRAAEEEE
ncbi:hypothetical protein A3SI_03448 [Nitritalea halalkaliphila LW7]|uniref:Transmembrane protein n=1 Tax=Nitritalea halalkaliphila LW7 TaxID=1189621 RepID=I5C9B2_9BACT|nr:hypothetical protein [Nitritalea halalkaliphila]EIM78414.1 hypothetical protein A3SI_03448 [Nitritalea halalkaliphila LW7]